MEVDGNVNEWSEQNKYNSFNSDCKGLSYWEHYQDILKWLNGKDYLPPPVECNLDPIAECNLDCYFCITQRYLKHQRGDVKGMRTLSREYMLELVDFLARWGVKGLCISGGGEPTLHEDLPEIITYAKDRMDVSVVTNASEINERLAQSLMKCRWVALSVDSADRETYKVIKGKDRFEAVLTNIQYLADLRKSTNSKVDLCFKFLILPENYHSIYDACLLAKKLGVQDFHVRPVDFEKKDIKNAHPLEFDMYSIEKQFALCHRGETKDFRVYTVTHKFDNNFHVVHNFNSCLAAPLIIPILSDGNGYLCVEHKMDSKYKLGSCYPDPKRIMDWWGSNEHRQMIKQVIPRNDCSRCIYSQYNRQMEECILEDRLCRSFP